MNTVSLPESGRSWEDIRGDIGEAREDDRAWHDSRTFIGGSYFGGDEVVEVANAAYREYINYNALYAARVYPSLARYEREVLDMLRDMLHAPAGAGGCLTTGGTESLLLCVHAAHSWARENRPGATDPEILLPRAAHPGFNKAAHLMGLRCVRVRETGDYHADVAAMVAAVNDNTIMIVGSAPNYPFGVTDPITELAALAKQHGLWMHVDACHGGFILPFARALGFDGPDFDLSVPGVTSLSIDIHKLGYANKGVSALLLQDADLEAWHRYSFDEWPAGTYATAAISGSRSGGGVASAWAVMNHLGAAGYRDIVGEILDVRRRYAEGIRAIPGLEIRGEPDGYLVVFGAQDAEIDIFAVDEAMEARGWLGGRLKDPPSLHLFLDRGHAESVDEYLADLRQVVENVRATGARGSGKEAVYTR